VSYIAPQASDSGNKKSADKISCASEGFCYIKNADFTEKFHPCNSLYNVLHENRQAATGEQSEPPQRSEEMEPEFISDAHKSSQETNKQKPATGCSIWALDFFVTTF